LPCPELSATWRRLHKDMRKNEKAISEINFIRETKRKLVGVKRADNIDGCVF
jgi:hypothetical protein